MPARRCSGEDLAKAGEQVDFEASDNQDEQYLELARIFEITTETEFIEFLVDVPNATTHPGIARLDELAKSPDYGPTFERVATLLRGSQNDPRSAWATYRAAVD